VDGRKRAQKAQKGEVLDDDVEGLRKHLDELGRHSDEIAVGLARDAEPATVEVTLAEAPD